MNSKIAIVELVLLKKKGLDWEVMKPALMDHEKEYIILCNNNNYDNYYTQRLCSSSCETVS